MVEWLAEWGYIGLFFGSFIAATLIPFSSDVQLIGLLATGADPVLAVIAATLGNWLGGLTSFGIGWLGKWEWIEKWLNVSREKLEKQKARIDKYGSSLAFFTWLPAIGDILAVGLGFYKTDPRKTAFFMLIGKCARYVMWAVIYYYVRPLF